MWTIKPIYESGIHIPDISSPHFHCMAKQNLNDPDPARLVTDGVMHPTIQFTDPTLPFFRYPNVHVKANWVGGGRESIWNAIYEMPPRTGASNLLPNLGLTWSSLDHKARMTENFLRPDGAAFVHMKTICQPPDNNLRRILVTVTPADSDKQDVLGGPVGVGLYDVKHGFSNTLVGQLNKFVSFLCLNWLSRIFPFRNTCLKSTSRMTDAKARAEQFLLTGRVEPFRSRPERTHETVIRLSTSFVGFLKSAVSFIPFAGAVSHYIVGLHYLVEYGPLWLSSSELIEAIGLILKLVHAAEFDHPSLFRLAFSDLPIRLYYAMAENRGFRGKNPNTAEQQNHHLHSMQSVPSLKEVEKFASLAIHIGYLSDPVEAQRLFRLQQFTLILHETQACYPFMLACGKAEALLLLPGTQGLGDVTVDVNAFECELSIGSVVGKAHKGIVGEARRLENFLSDIMCLFAEKGFKIRIAGHSLGAGVGAVLTCFLKQRQQIKDIFFFGFGSPPCLTADLAACFEDVAVNVVLRDDIVCRATTGNVDRLLTWILGRETSERFTKYMRSDLESLKNWKQIIALKRRADVVGEESQRVGSSSMTRVGKIREFFLWTFSRKKSPPTDTLVEGFTIPGKIIHIYKHHGAYTCGLISRSAETLARIEIQPGMLTDHLGDNYVNALRECILNSGAQSVTFAPFNSKSSCSCCGSDFLWNSVLKAKIHSLLAQHNCGKCGALVCGACSAQERLEMGRVFPVKICDKCKFIPSFSKL